MVIMTYALFSRAQSQIITIDQLKDSIEYILKEKEIPGAFVTVVNKDSTLFQSGFGYADVEKKLRVNTTHLFRIASVSKTFTAMAVMKLVQEGKLSLEDELKKICPEIEFKNEWETTHPVKVKHLLTHRSGFDDMHIATLIERKTVSMTALDEVLVYKNSFKSNWKPGHIFSYSNPGYALLGYIIEKKSGMPYQEYIAKKVFAPLGMQNTQYFSTTTEKSTNLFAKGYTKPNVILEMVAENELVPGEAGGGMLSNAEDMARFLQYFLNVEQQDSLDLIGRQGVLQMEKLHSQFEVENNIKSGYSLGISDRQFGDPVKNFKGHSGGIDGFITNYIYSRKSDLGIAISTNLFGAGNGRIVDLLVNHFTTVEQKNTDDFPYLEADLEKFKAWEGEHKELSDQDNIFNFINFPVRTKKVWIENNELHIKEVLEDPETYRYVGGNAFKDEGETLPTVYLTEYEGEKSMFYYESTFEPTSGIGYLIFRSVLALSLLVGLILTLVSIVQLIALPFRRSSKKAVLKTLSLVTPYWLIVTSSVLSISNIDYSKVWRLAEFHPTSIAVFLTTLLYPFSCALAIYMIYRQWPQFRQKPVKYFYGFSLFGCVFITVYCMFMGWFALRLWSY